jgi:hypothetical protein
MNQAQTAQGSAATVKSTPAFKNMKFFQKILFLGKAVIFFITMGFVYPNIFTE